MVIKGDDFIFTPVNSYCSAFDVELLQTINKGKSNERQEFKNVAYGMNLEAAIKAVIMYRINKKEDTLELKKFLKMFTEGINELREFCHGEKTEED